MSYLTNTCLGRMAHLACMWMCVCGVSVLVACSPTSGRAFDSAQVSRIERGKTTKAEIVEKLGPPQTKTVTSKGEVWLYQHMRYGNYFETMGFIFGANEYKGKMKALSVTFQGDVVSDYTFTE